MEIIIYLQILFIKINISITKKQEIRYQKKNILIIKIIIKYQTKIMKIKKKILDSIKIFLPATKKLTNI
jgi:hypothetical protein